MNYIEIAKGSPKNRGYVIDKKDLVKFINGEPLYRSMYLYGEDAKEHALQHGSLKGYFGERAIDNVLIDIDKGSNTNELTLAKLQSILYDLTELSITEQNYQSYFSGSGYHLVLTNQLFNFTPHRDLPYLVKSTVKKLFQDVDPMVYMRTGIYRVQHTLNQKTNLYKIPLTRKEVFSLKCEEIMEMAKSNRVEFPYSELVGEGELEEYVVTQAPSLRAMTSVSEPTKIVPCVQAMLNQGPVEGGRHNTSMRIVSHFKRHGIPSDYAKVSMLHWNNKSMEEQDVIEQVENVYNRNYRYGCNDTIMHKHCKPHCIYFKRKDYFIGVKDAKTLQEEFDERMTTDFSGRSINLTKMLGLEGLDASIYPGELVTIFGPTGSSKTTLAQNIALGVDFQNDSIESCFQIPTLYLSLELSAWYMHRRNLQIVSGMSKEMVNREYREVFKTHSHNLDHIQIQTIAPSIEQIQNKIIELQPALVIVDYIDLVETPPHIRGEYEQVKHISHALSSMAVNMDVIIIQVSQVSRDYSRNEILDLYAGKGSGAIENASRKVIGLNGQADSSKKHLQMFKNTDGELFSAQLEWRPSFRLRRINE